MVDKTRYPNPDAIFKDLAIIKKLPSFLFRFNKRIMGDRGIFMAVNKLHWGLSIAPVFVFLFLSVTALVESNDHSLCFNDI